jgi:hypothetical protein
MRFGASFSAEPPKFNIFKNQLTCFGLEDNLMQDEEDHRQVPAVRVPL